MASSSSTISTTRTILVTGGNRGIGKALCQRLLKEYPDTHVFLGSRNIMKGEQAAQDILQKLKDKDNDNDNDDYSNRLNVIEMDVSNKQSVETAANVINESTSYKSKLPFYAIVNNAGRGWDPPYKQTMDTNYFGTRNVNNVFGKLVQPGGRIVNISSASGPSWLSQQSRDIKIKLSQPWKYFNSIKELDDLAKSIKLTDDTYGISKAFINAYTVLHAKEEGRNDSSSRIIVNAVTPGFIATDMGKPLGATKSPHDGCTPILFALFDKELEESFPTGRYYGSDCKRSPLDTYRGPGEPVYEGPDWE